MFDNISQKIKSLATVVCVLGIIGSVGYFVYLFFTSLAAKNGWGIFLSFVWLAVGILASWAGEFTLYGFGHLIDNSDKLVAAANAKGENKRTFEEAKSEAIEEPVNNNGPEERFNFNLYKDDISIVIPGNCRRIIADSARGFRKLQLLKFEKGITFIGAYSFADCKSLETVYLPETLKEINDGAFAGCSALSEIYFDGTKAQWEKVKKGVKWNKGIPAHKICCSDGYYII